jgi:PAS domain S-box-containing protein
LKSSEFARSALDTLEASVAVIDERGFIIAVNKAWRDFAKANHPSPESVCEGANYLAVCDAVQGPETGQAAEFAAALRAIIGSERDYYRLEYPCHSPQTQRWFYARVTRFPGGGPARATVHHIDFTERKIAELKLHASELRYREMFESSLLGISETNANNEFATVNLTYARMYGYQDPDSLIAEVRDIGQLYADPADRRDVLRILADRGYMEPREFRVKRRDGSIFNVMVSARELRSEAGEFLGYRAGHVDISKLKRVETELRASHKQMQALASRTQAAFENERTNTARKIHDLLSQTLTRLKIDLVWLQRRLENLGDAPSVKVLSPRVAEMVGMADEAVSTVQRIATDLRPAVLDSLGLCAALEWLARDFRNHGEIGCRIFVPERELSIDKDTATAAFRIVQESLANVNRHSRATEVEIRLEEEAEQVVLSIHDNGIGIDQEKLKDPISMGLAGMRERALLMGGSFDVLSWPALGTGTTVEARFPLPDSDRFPLGE